MSQIELSLNYRQSGCKPSITKIDGNKIQLTLCLKYHYVDVYEKGKRKGCTEIRTRSERDCLFLAKQWAAKFTEIEQ